MERQWFLFSKHEQSGPYSWEELKNIAASGSIETNDLVWAEGMEDWVKAGSMEGLLPAPGPAADSLAPPDKVQQQPPEQNQSQFEKPPASIPSQNYSIQGSQPPPLKETQSKTKSPFKILLLAFGGVVLFAMVAFIFLVVFEVVKGDNAAQPPSPGDRKLYSSVADIAEMALPGIVYLEAYDAGDPEFGFMGTGFVISADGKIVTNYHNLDGTGDAIVEIDGQIYDQVFVLAASEAMDLAILKVDAEGLPALHLAENLEDVRIGDPIVAMGNPMGFKRTVTEGIISTLEREVDWFDYELIQISAPISKGNSGGPLFNMYGEVIGVNTFGWGEGQNLNFAVPINKVHQLLNDLQQPMTVAEVFGGSGSVFSSLGTTYSHRPGEFAVALSWRGDADLDLEIWTEDFEFIASAAEIGESPDIMQGGQGQEWITFREHALGVDGQTIDLSEGRFIVTVFYSGPEPGENDSGTADAELTIFYPDGREIVVLGEEIWYQYPYETWFALIVDPIAADYKILDLFVDVQMIALLEWDTEANLDLFAWDYELEELFHPIDFWYGWDFTSGYAGIEKFHFGIYESDGQEYDFTTGLYDLAVRMENTGTPETTATLTILTVSEDLIFDDIKLSHYTFRFTPDSRGDYAWMPIIELNPETMRYTTISGSDEILFLD